MVGPSEDRESDNLHNTASNSDDPIKSASVPMEASPVTPGRLVYVRRRLENNPNVASDSQLKQSQGSLSGRLDWEERYHQLQTLLNKLDDSDPKDYVQMLRPLTSLDLSRHAVQLEKRSIQLSLEEAKEMQRVAALNFLGRAVNNEKSPPNSGG